MRRLAAQIWSMLSLMLSHSSFDPRSRKEECLTTSAKVVAQERRVALAGSEDSLAIAVSLCSPAPGVAGDLAERARRCKLPSGVSEQSREMPASWPWPTLGATKPG
jgi:hypothetical protein